jgi:acetyl-CoA carboxylase carboxyltransferase component
MGVMEGESAVQAVHGPAIEEAKRRAGGAGEGNDASDAELTSTIEAMRADYEHQLDARYAAARGYVDAIIYPEETRDVLAMALRSSLSNPGPHLGAFVLPPFVGAPS